MEHLEERKEKLQKLELEKLEKIEKIKRFFKRRLDEQEGGGCDMCEKVFIGPRCPWGPIYGS